jgi:hypothetical protein
MSQNSAYFHFRLPVWARRSHPIYRQETQRHAASRGLAVLQLVFLPILFAVTGLALIGALVVMLPLLVDAATDGVVQGSLWVTLAIVATIQLGAGALCNVMVIAQTSPVISGEIELQSWRLLRTTTLPLHEIVFAKLSAALMHLRLMLGGLMILRIITTITAVLLFVISLFRNTVYNLGPGEAAAYMVELRWLPLMLPLVTVMVAYLAQPVIQFLLNGSLGLLASAYTRSRGQAIAAALMGRLGLWAFALLFHIAAFSSLTSMLQNWSQPEYASIESFHGLPAPTTEAVTAVTCVVVAGYAVSVISGQIGIALMSLGLALRRARRLGV